MYWLLCCPGTLAIVWGLFRGKTIGNVAGILFIFQTVVLALIIIANLIGAYVFS